MALQIFRMWLINSYLIWKILAFANTTCKLYNDKHLFQNHCFLLLRSLLYFFDNFFCPSNTFHPFYLFELSYIVLLYFLNQRVQCHNIDAPKNLWFQMLNILTYLRYFYIIKLFSIISLNYFQILEYCITFHQLI